jgi:hypothetical protein
MRAFNLCLILIVVTVHTSLAKVFTDCQLLSELRRYEVPKDQLATCEFSSYIILRIYFIPHTDLTGTLAKHQVAFRSDVHNIFLSGLPMHK